MLAMKAFTHPCLQANTTLETELIDGCWFLMNPLFSRGTVAAEEEAWLACSQVHKNYISYRSLKKSHLLAAKCLQRFDKTSRNTIIFIALNCDIILPGVY